MSKHTDWQALQAVLAQEIDAYLRDLADVSPAMLSYALVDAGQIPEMRGAFLEQMEIPHAKLFDGTKEHKIAQYGPVLIPLDRNANSGQLPVSQLLHSMQYGWTVSWITSPLDLIDLSKHLAGHLNGVLEDGREVLIRYYDPRNLAPFMENMDAKTKTALLTPIRHWTYWDRNLALSTIDGAGLTDMAGVQSTQIASSMQQAMANAAVPDLIMSNLLADSDPRQFEEWLPHTIYHSIVHLIHNARTYGVSEFQDIYLFVSLSINIHPEFDKLLPIFVSEKKNITLGEITLLELVLGIDDDQWNNLSQTGKKIGVDFLNTTHNILMVRNKKSE
jgi:hypothetical protein